MSDESASQLTLRTLVCGYTVTELPVAWLRVFHRFEHALGRAGWRVRVRLYPLEELPDEVDVLVVPPELEQRARALRPAARVIVTTREQAASAVEALLRELESGAVLAERAKPGEPRIVTHRGAEIL